MNTTNDVYETALFMLIRQRIIYLGAARGMSPDELNVKAYREMQGLLEDNDLGDVIIELEKA